MDFETFIESEAAAALERCEVLAAGWGLSVAIRDSRAVYGLKLRGCGGLFVPHVDASRFGIPAGYGLAAVDVQQLLPLSDPVGRVVSVAAHEVAHGVQDELETISFGPAIETPAGFEPRIWTPERLQEVGRPAWSGHGPDFLRACVHVAFRMWEADLPVSLEWAVNHGAYNLSPFASYFTELREECGRLAGVPIVEALRARAPESFLELWRADIARAAAQNSLGSSRRPVSVAHSSEEPSSAQT